jgi:cyclase
MRELKWVGVFLAGLISASVAWAEKPKAVEVWKNLFTLTHGEGINSNTTFLITNEGVIVVDTRVTPTEAKKVKEEVRKQTQLPILYTINTHYHGDHSFGNQIFKDTHTIIAHENVRKALEGESGQAHLEVFKSFKIPGMDETVITPPNMIFKEKMHVYAGEYHLELIHAPGHTDGDLFIYIETLKTIIAGDLITTGKIPYMGDAYIEDWIKALNHIGDLDAEIYIPGHGNPGGKPLLIAMKHYLIDLRRLITFQIDEGRSLKETQDAVRPVLEKKFRKWEKLEWLDGNIERAYMEFSMKKKS